MSTREVKAEEFTGLVEALRNASPHVREILRDNSQDSPVLDHALYLAERENS